MFYNRQDERRALADAWERAGQGEPQLVVVSGHRRVGKTFLVTHFLDSLDATHAAYHFATRQAEHVELGRFAETMAPFVRDMPLLSNVRFDSWEQALRIVVERARTRPIALVVDEASYLTESTPGFASIVQAVWDEARHGEQPPRLMLILTGSATTVVEAMVGPNGPLRGRASKHLRVRPFDLPTVAGILDLSPSDAIEAYAAGGGWPPHVLAWDTTTSVDENLLRLAGTSDGILRENAEFILQELPDGPGFQRVLAAIGRGRTRYSDIQSDADQRIDYPLDFLTSTGLVRRETPVGAPRRARPLYTIEDPYLRFWFEVLYGHTGAIDGGRGEAVLRSRLGQWQRHRAWVFEEAARAHAQRLAATGVFGEGLIIGRWWPYSGTASEVDVVGLRGNRTAVVGEAKWSEGPVDPRLIRALTDKLVGLPNPVADPTFCLWTRGEAPEAFTEAHVRVYGPGDVVSQPPT